MVLGLCLNYIVHIDLYSVQTQSKLIEKIRQHPTIISGYTRACPMAYALGLHQGLGIHNHRAFNKSISYSTNHNMFALLQQGRD